MSQDLYVYALIKWASWYLEVSVYVGMIRGCGVVLGAKQEISAGRPVMVTAGNMEPGTWMSQGGFGCKMVKMVPEELQRWL